MYYFEISTFYHTNSTKIKDKRLIQYRFQDLLTLPQHSHQIEKIKKNIKIKESPQKHKKQIPKKWLNSKL